MDYTNFNMRLDNNLRQRAYPILEQYGLTPSQAVRMFFNQIAQTGKVPLSFDWADTNQTVLNAKTQAHLQKTQQEFANGEFTICKNSEELAEILAEIKHG